MNKNHFIFGYVGNKRGEVKQILECIEDIEQYDTIIEPFCGSSAFSYQLSLLYPNKFKYILNDNDTLLINLYKMMKNDDIKELKELEDKTRWFRDNHINKKDYDELMKNKKIDLFAWFVSVYIYQMRPGICPISRKPTKVGDFSKIPVVEFLKKENVEIYNIDAIDIYNKYSNDKKALIFLDPPYLMASNDFYGNTDAQIYEYLFKNNIKNSLCKVVLCLENTFIIKLLFKNEKQTTYQKKYNGFRKKTVEHVVITN